MVLCADDGLVDLYTFLFFLKGQFRFESSFFCQVLYGAYGANRLPFFINDKSFIRQVFIGTIRTAKTVFIFPIAVMRQNAGVDLLHHSFAVFVMYPFIPPEQVVANFGMFITS